MRNQTNNHHDRAGSSDGFWSKLGQILGRSSAADAGEPVYVKVWDAYRDTYRRVNLQDQSDPLWYAASQIAKMQDQQSISPRSAA